MIRKVVRKCACSDLPIARSWASDWINVLGIIRTNVYFPVYSNGLKDIASILGATWGERIASGIECIARRLWWEQSMDSLIKEEIIDYNLHECLAVQLLVNFL